jgi:hypothetical protein
MSINTYLSHRELLIRLMMLLAKSVFPTKYSSWRFLLPHSMFHGYRQQLYRLSSVALLWFPPVGFNQYSNPLRRVKLHTPSIISIISSWTLLKTFYVAIYSATLLYSLLVRLNRKVNLLTYQCHTYTCPLAVLTHRAHLFYYILTISWIVLTTSHGRLILYSGIPSLNI